MLQYFNCKVYRSKLPERSRPILATEGRQLPENCSFTLLCFVKNAGTKTISELAMLSNSLSQVLRAVPYSSHLSPLSERLEQATYLVEDTFV